jgi:hypothetical protein
MKRLQRTKETRLLLSNRYDSAPLAHIQKDGMLGLSEYERLVGNAEAEN